MDAWASADAAAPPPPAIAAEVFGDRLPLVVRYANLLAGDGVTSGVLGPREIPRLWDRHLLNSAVLTELIPAGHRVLDIGTGAGLPGIPLALARPDLEMVLVEPLERRVRFLQRCADALPGVFHVKHARAEALHGHVTAPTVVARAVAPLERLAAWCLPLLAPDGRVLAIKGASAEEEARRSTAAVRAAGGAKPSVIRCGVEVVDPPTTVTVLRRRAGTSSRRGA